MPSTIGADCRVGLTGRQDSFGQTLRYRLGKGCRPSSLLDYEAEEKELRTASYYRAAFGSAGSSAWPQLRPRKKAVRSPATAAGSSAGAKCPPRGKTVQRWMLYKRSKYERGSSPSGTVWCAKTPNAVGVLT
jgi:hypothetical protein